MNQLFKSNESQFQELIAKHNITLIAAETHHGLIVQALDPATAAALWEIAKGLLASLGASAVGKWLGAGSSGDIESLLKRLIDEIANVFRKILDQRDISVATSQVKAATILLSEYVKSRNDAEYKLHNADILALNASTDLERLLPFSVNAYVFAALTRISALQQQALITRSDGDVENLTTFALSVHKYVASAAIELAAINDCRVTTIAISENPGEPGGRIEIQSPRGTPVTYVAKYCVDGVERATTSTSQSEALRIANISRDADLLAVRKDFEAKVNIYLTETNRHISELGTWKLPLQAN